MKIYIILILAVCTASLGLAQNTDIVTLKDGTLVKGTISEYIPDGTLTIVLADGRIKTFDASEISLMEESNNRTFNQRNTGYFNTSTIGTLIGKDSYYSTAGFQFNLINGYKKNNFYYGIGTGIETDNGSLFTPLFADVTFQFTDKKNSPFLNVYAGKTFNFNYTEDLHHFSSNNFKNGEILGVNFGIRAQMNKDLAFLFSAGYRYSHLTGKYINRTWTGTDWFSQEVDAIGHLNRFNLKIGLLFN